MKNEIEKAFEDKFYCPAKFAQEIEQMVQTHADMNYIDAIVSFCEINSIDALSLKIKNDETVKIKSKRGEVQAKVQITDKIKAGTVFLPMHWGFSQKNMCEVNSLMHEKSCPISKQPELKACSVIIVPN